MTTSYESGLETTVAGLREAVGAGLGHTAWQEMTQQRVNAFADTTDDHQFIHVDAEKAKATPFGGTVAHGFLTLSLLSPLVDQLLRVTDSVMGLNYGLDRVRFPAPLRVGSRYRGTGEIVEVSEVAGGVHVKLKLTVEVESQAKPACVAELLVRFYGG